MTAIGDVYRMQVVGQLGGQQILNNYHFTTDTATYTPADFTALATDCKELWRALQNPAFTYRSWRATQLWGTEVTPIAAECRADGGLVFEGNYTSLTSGSGGASDYLPPQCAFVWTLNTGQIGRRRRGRIYVAGWGEGDQTNGQWTPTMLTASLAAMTTFTNKYMGDTSTSPVFRWGVWSQRVATGCVRRKEPPFDFHNIETPNYGDAFRPITGVVQRSTVFSQRRRVVGVGR